VKNNNQSYEGALIVTHAFTILTIIDDYGLSVEGYRLYCHLVRMTRNGASPYQSTPDHLAELCNMTQTQINAARTELEEAGLIAIMAQPVNQRWVDTITVIDLTDLNERLYAVHSINLPEDLSRQAFVEALKLIKKQQREAVRARPPRSPGYIYIARAGQSTRYKIGKSMDVTKRIKQMQTDSAEPIALVHMFLTQHKERTEKYLHQRFKHQKLQGEWYTLTETDIAWLTSLETFDPPETAA
jgi:DNA-binding MarR family transcriptional regulator